MALPFQTTRQTQVATLLNTLARGECAAIFGLSNTGKSPMLRALPAAENLAQYARLAGRPGELVYVDCNRVVELTAPGFFEVVVRSLVEALEDESNGAQKSSALLGQLREQHNRITVAASTFQASLAFNNAISEACGQLGRNLILLLDEFDEVYSTLEDRTLLNLRALKDKFGSRLTYVTATTRALNDPALRGAAPAKPATGEGRWTSSNLGAARHENEFAELFTANTMALRLLSENDARAVLNEIGGHTLPEPVQQTVLRAAGGHFGLLGALAHAAQHQPQSPSADPNVRAECLKLWNQLRPEEQTALKSLVTAAEEGLNPYDRMRLNAFGLLTEDSHLFSEVFAAFVRHQAEVPETVTLGVRVDEDAGEVWVDGVKVTVLTDLEYRLMRLMHERIDRLTTKEQIVETVWGGQYMDRVDDARIEKLVSRLRAKVEPEPLHPRYLLTQRGRGYKLVSRPVEARDDEDAG